MAELLQDTSVRNPAWVTDADKARLFEAAPELYRALYDYLYAVHPATQRVAATAAKAALAKARGDNL